MKILDKLHNKLKYNKKLMLFLSIIVLAGIIAGAFLIVILKNNDKELVIDSIKQFIQNTDNSFSLFKNSFLINLLIIISIWILGISVIGSFVAIAIIFWKSFTLGFTISSFILTYNVKGLILAFCYIFPHIIINLFLFMYLGTYAIKFSILIIKCIFHKINLDFRKLTIIYLKVLLICIIIIFLTAIYESFITPLLLKYLTSLLF